MTKRSSSARHYSTSSLPASPARAHWRQCILQRQQQQQQHLASTQVPSRL